MVETFCNANYNKVINCMCLFIVPIDLSLTYEFYDVVFDTHFNKHKCLVNRIVKWKLLVHLILTFWRRNFFLF